MKNYIENGVYQRYENDSKEKREEKGKLLWHNTISLQNIFKILRDRNTRLSKHI